MAKLILMRHGQSKWNELNLFTGWVDVPLSQKGIQEAIDGGQKIKDIPIDIIFTSTLVRAQQTAMLVALQNLSEKVPVVQHGDGKMKEWSSIHNEESLMNTIPVVYAEQINERMYGKLQGLNKAETIKKYGESQVQIWRRSFDICPPDGESLKMTAERSIPYFRQEIVPALEKGLNVLVAAHGNSLRSIIMSLDNLSKDEVVHLEIPTGEPIIYNYAGGKFSK